MHVHLLETQHTDYVTRMVIAAGACSGRCSQSEASSSNNEDGRPARNNRSRENFADRFKSIHQNVSY